MGVRTGGGPVLVERPSVHDALEELFRQHYVMMVRAARVLLRDPGSAEEVVQEAFVRLHGRSDQLSEPARAVAYLRSTVLNLARSRLRRLGTARLYAARLWVGDRLEDGAERRAEQRVVIDALRRLPLRQRECLVLRYYLDLTEAEIADVMGISPGSVKTHAVRGLAALQKELPR
jgi:RNA polymerase sigma-70 factor (sigma-E family)